MDKQQSKPLHPRGCGLPFKPDSMAIKVRFVPFGGEKPERWFRDRTFTRAQRKRQRRVDQYMIDLGLNDDE